MGRDPGRCVTRPLLPRHHPSSPPRPASGSQLQHDRSSQPHPIPPRLFFCPRCTSNRHHWHAYLSISVGLRVFVDGLVQRAHRWLVQTLLPTSEYVLLVLHWKDHQNVAYHLHGIRGLPTCPVIFSASSTGRPAPPHCRQQPLQRDACRPQCVRLIRTKQSGNITVP